MAYPPSYSVNEGGQGTGAVLVFGGAGLVVVGRMGPLVVHFEEEKIGELVDVVAVGGPVIAAQAADSSRLC